MLRTNLMWKFMQTLLELKYINSLLGGGGGGDYHNVYDQFAPFPVISFKKLCMLPLYLEKKEGLGKDRINFLQ